MSSWSRSFDLLVEGEAPPDARPDSLDALAEELIAKTREADLLEWPRGGA